MKRFKILGGGQSWHSQQLQQAAIGRGHATGTFNYASLLARVPDSCSGHSPLFEQATDCVIVRSMPRGTLEQIIFRMDLLGMLASSGFQVVNHPRALEIAIDKYLGLVRLAAAGLPVPRTIVCEDVTMALEAIDELGGVVVVKPLFGSGGEGLIRLTSRTATVASLSALAAANGVLYLQQFCDHAGYDFRLLVIDSEVYGMRRMNVNDWRLNVRLGATVEPLSITDDLRDLAIRSARAVGATIAAIDVLPDSERRLWVLEVNAVPGWHALQSTVSCNLADRIIACLEKGVAHDFTSRVPEMNVRDHPAHGRPSTVSSRE